MKWCVKWWCAFVLAPGLAFAQEADAPAEEAKPDRVNLMNLPIPVDQTVKGLKVPMFDIKGKMLMQFFAEEAHRISQEKVEFARLSIEMFDEEGEQELFIDLPESSLDLTTHILTSDKPVKLRRPEFEMEGDTMEFNTRERKGRMTGNIRMKLFDRKKL
jgi:hypothetical protein